MSRSSLLVCLAACQAGVSRDAAPTTARGKPDAGGAPVAAAAMPIDAAPPTDAAVAPGPSVAIVTCTPIQTRCGGTDDYVLDCQGPGGLRGSHGAYATWMSPSAVLAVVRFRPVPPRVVAFTAHTCAGDWPATIAVTAEFAAFQRVGDPAAANALRDAWLAAP